MRIFDFKMYEYRSFLKSENIRITPLTFFVGENSAGKTSALAALNFAMRLREDGSPLGKLNLDPFDLGSFDQIAFKYPDGDHSAHQFRFEVEKEIVPGDGSGLLSMMLDEDKETDRPHNPKDRVKACVCYTFSSEFGNAELAALRIQVEDASLLLDLISGQVKINVGEAASADIIAGEGGAPLFKALKKQITTDFRLLSFIISQGYQKALREQSQEIDQATKSKIERLFRTFSTYLDTQPKYVFAGAPTRSIPERVYSDSNVNHQSDGRSTPYVLREKKISSKSEWNRIFRSLQAFGKATEMFNSIDIRRLTSDIAGPFQVRVRVGQRTENIIDVGYGVSQSIPFVTELADHPHDAFVLLQQPEVHLHPRAQAGLGSFLANHITEHADSNIVVETHSDFLIDRVRQSIREGKLNRHLVSLVYFEKVGFKTVCYSLMFDANGDVIDPPLGYRSFFMREQLANAGII